MATVRKIFAEMQRANQRAVADSERRRKAKVKAHTAAVRELEKARKAEERAVALALRAAETEEKRHDRAAGVERKRLDAERKRLEKEAKQAHEQTRLAEVDQLNKELENIFSEIDGLLAATIAIDDYVDLESLRQTVIHPQFDSHGLEEPISKPRQIIVPSKPKFVEPDPPKGFFGRKKQARQAMELAEQEYRDEQRAWVRISEEASRSRVKAHEQWHVAETHRRNELEISSTEYAEACRAREQDVSATNEALDQLIANLGYGTSDAIEEYVGIVAANSVYPDHFPVDCDFRFDAATAELHMSITVPPPSTIPTTKSYKYTKSKDEISSSSLSQKASKDRYSSAVHQVSLRAIHETFEADRRGLIKTVSLQLGTNDLNPATGLQEEVVFVAVAAERSAFQRIDLRNVTPVATLTHLGATVSKNPFGLIGIDPSGVRTT